MVYPEEGHIEAAAKTFDCSHEKYGGRLEASIGDLLLKRALVIDENAQKAEEQGKGFDAICADVIRLGEGLPTFTSAHFVSSKVILPPTEDSPPIVDTSKTHEYTNTTFLRPFYLPMFNLICFSFDTVTRESYDELQLDNNSLPYETTESELCVPVRAIKKFDLIGQLHNSN